jgi:hypothetical protein
MGPITIFDKSALQALSLDEAVWFDAFFSANVVPMFHVETLADLEKQVATGRTPEEVVGRLAEKTPSDAYPNVHHRQLILAELTGNAITMNGQVIIGAGPRMMQPDGSYGVHVEEFPEEAALQRWVNHDFLEVERETARRWRAELAAHDPERMIGIAKNILGPTKVADLEELARFIHAFCASSESNVLALALDVLDVPPALRTLATKRWIRVGRPNLDVFLPYCAHVLEVDLLYYLGMYRSFISSERASNRVDMAYLYYLPFAMTFVSGDRLHHRTAPLLQRPDQSYMAVHDLKAALAEIDAHYDSLPDEIKALGVTGFAHWPPSNLDNLVTSVWDQHMRKGWRQLAEQHEAQLGEPRDAEADRAKIAELQVQMARARPATAQEEASAPALLNYGVIRRQVAVQKGKWLMFSEEIEDAARRP